jgi:flagellar FliL protein
VLLLLLGGIGAAAWYFLRNHDPVPAKSGDGKAVVAKAVSSKRPVFVALEPFTVNLMHEDNSSQYLQIGLTLKLTDASFGEVIKVYLPEIRSRVLLLLASKKPSEISTSEGKKLLVEELAREIVRPLPDSSSAKMLEAVLFTSFVIQ